ncbi:MAG: hypothetical protein HFE73_03940 [Firmicutes bacterium]|nr:hypothetical protein [Bacillota bacterium]
MMRQTSHSKKDASYTYWKRPWHKWAILLAALSQFLCLLMNIQEYNDISAAGIFSASEWTVYASQKTFQCAINGMAAACFSGILLIGSLARSKRATQLAEGLLLLILGLTWGAAGFALHLNSKVLWLVILLLAFGGAFYDFYTYKKLPI